MEMLKLETEERNRKICEAVRKAEKLPDNYRLYVTTVQFTIAKEETPDEIQAEVFVTEGKIDSVKYLLAWDGEKNEFCRPQMIWRKYANYRLMADFGMFNPLTRAVREGYKTIGAMIAADSVGYADALIDEFVKRGKRMEP